MMAASSAKGDGTITDGTASFTWHNLATSATEGNADFQTAAAAPDQVYQIWWWYRIDSGATPDSQEQPFPTPDVETYLADRAVFEWHGLGPAQATFDARLTTTLTQSSATWASISQVMTITNTSATPLNANLYFYADPDVAGSALDDTSSLAGFFEDEGCRATDGPDRVESLFCRYCPSPANESIFLGTGHTAGADLLGLLNDSAPTKIFPWAPSTGDVAWGAHFSYTVEPGSGHAWGVGGSTAINRPLGAYCLSATCSADFSGDNRVDGRDILRFVQCLVGGPATPGCACADMNLDDAINQDDLAIFVPKLLGIGDPNPNCP